MKDHITAVTGELYWRYHIPENKGATMWLLTKGKIAVRGIWEGEFGERYIAWCPMPKRNKQLEEELGL